MSEIDTTKTTESNRGTEVLAQLDSLELLGALRQVFSRRDNIRREWLRVTTEYTRIALGRSDVALPARDWRFANPAWSDNPVFHRLAQSYLAWHEGMQRLVDDADLDWRTEERARFAMTLLTTAFAPSNALVLNPDALEKAFETGGKSVVRGLRKLGRDAVKNKGMPSSVDEKPFEVGRNIAVTPGAVVYRDDILELIQYTPSTPAVHARPVVLIPPQINKYYFMDLAPGRSFVEYAVGRGLQFFCVSWRNPTAEQGSWNLDTYAAAIERALEAAAQITGSDTVNTVALCAGGITTAAMMGHLAARGEQLVHAATFAVTLLDFDVPSTIGMFGSAKVVRNATRASRKAGVLDGRSLGAIFSLFRPNELVWNYWVNNYLLGKEPAAFDILFWNNDSARLAAGLHADFLDILLHNSLARPGERTVLNTPVDLSKIECDSYVIAGQRDHLTPWEACYSTTQLLGGECEFILTSSGHIASLVNPPIQSKMIYRTGPTPPPSPEEWLGESTSHPGTWWEHWAEWVKFRSGDEQPAPRRLGSRKHPAGEPAPGLYVVAP